MPASYGVRISSNKICESTNRPEPADIARGLAIIYASKGYTNHESVLEAGTDIVGRCMSVENSLITGTFSFAQSEGRVGNGDGGEWTGIFGAGLRFFLCEDIQSLGSSASVVGLDCISGLGHRYWNNNRAHDARKTAARGGI